MVMGAPTPQMPVLSSGFHGNIATWPDGFRVVGVHGASECVEEICIIHNPTAHDLNTLPLRFDGGSFLREMPDGSLTPDPDDLRFRQGETIILENSAYCSVCDTKVVSKHRRHYSRCKCAAMVSVNGGLDFPRHVIGPGYVDTTKTAKLMIEDEI